MKQQLFQSTQNLIQCSGKLIDIYSANHPFKSSTVTGKDRSKHFPSFLSELDPVEPLSNQLLIEFQYLQSPYWKFIPKSMIEQVEWKMTEELFSGINKLLEYIDKCIECWDLLMRKGDQFPHCFKNIFERKVPMWRQQSEFSMDEILCVASIQDELHELMMKLRDDMTLRKLMIEQERHYLLKQEDSDKQLFSLVNNELVKSKMKTLDFFNLVWEMTPMLTNIEVEERMHRIRELMKEWRSL